VSDVKILWDFVEYPRDKGICFLAARQKNKNAVKAAGIFSI
jgi:hypothetical protein